MRIESKIANREYTWVAKWSSEIEKQKETLNAAKEKIDLGYWLGKEKVDSCTWLNWRTERLEQDITNITMEYFLIDAGIQQKV